MPEWLIVVLPVAGGILLFWLGLLVVLWVQQRRAGTGVDWRGILRLVPDVIRLLRRLASSKDVPRGVRWMLLALLGYLLLPIDLVPDFLPVIGYADDAIIVDTTNLAPEAVVERILTLAGERMGQRAGCSS